MTDQLPISKQQFIDSIIPFINYYKRLPFLLEDDVIVPVEIDGEIEDRVYRASRYIIAYYKSQDKLIEELFKQGIITYKLIADIIGETETVTKNAILKQTKNPNIRLRKQLEVFFNNDFYEKELGKYTDKCSKCTKSKECGQGYWITGIACSMYTEKKIKK